MRVPNKTLDLSLLYYEARQGESAFLIATSSMRMPCRYALWGQGGTILLFARFFFCGGGGGDGVGGERSPGALVLALCFAWS